MILKDKANDFSEDDNNNKKVYHYAKIPVLYDRHTCS